MNTRSLRPFRRALLALAALLFALAACTTPTGAPSVVRLDTLAPSAGAPGTAVEVTGRIPAGATLHLCGVPLTGLLLSDPETAAATHFARATGAVPSLTPGSTCTLTVVRGGQTLPHGGATLSFTTSLVATAPVAPTNLVASAGNASVAIAFSVPDDGGSPIALLQFSLDGGVSWSDAAATTSPLRIVGLTNDQPVTVRLRVLNAVGPGPASDPVTATPTLWPFATSVSATGIIQAEGVSALPDGSAIVTGSFQGTAAFGAASFGAASFGATILVSDGVRDVFVAKTDPAGGWAWAIRGGGPSTSQALGVSTFADGSAIVTGYFEDVATFGATTLLGVGARDVFVAKTTPGGGWAWATRAGGTVTVEAVDVRTLPDGSALIAGRFEGAATFGATTLISAGGRDAFVARTNPDGSWAWATGAGGTSSDLAFGVSALADGSAIVAGSFDGTAAFGAITLVAAGSGDVFVAKTHPGGGWAWATRAGGTSSDQVRKVSALADGSAIVTGYFAGTAAFGATTLTSAGIFDVFVAKIDPDGSWLWATRAGGTGYEQGVGVSALADGSAIVVGLFEGPATFGATTLASSADFDVFVAKTDPQGGWAWATRATGTGYGEARSVSALADGSAIVTGYFSGTTAFGAKILSSPGSFGSFVAKVDAGAP